MSLISIGDLKSLGLMNYVQRCLPEKEKKDDSV